MNARLTDQEIASFRDALRGYEPAQEVLDSLQNHQGDFETSFNHLFGDQQSFDGDDSLWKDTIEVLREKIGSLVFPVKTNEISKTNIDSKELTGSDFHQNANFHGKYQRAKIKELGENPHSKVIFEILVG